MSVASSTQSRKIRAAWDELCRRLSGLSFEAPVSHVLNPLEYAAEPVGLYLEKYLCGPKDRILLLGMNPGPWGMAQTGVPFGEVDSVKNYLGITGPVQPPVDSHPKRPIQGFECPRSEVSGRRLWGFFQEHFPDPADFARRFAVLNYCPLIFLEESGRNRTPDKLSKSEREALYAACDQSLVEVLKALHIEKAYGVGKFAESRLRQVQKQVPSLNHIDSILHPSPASPAANRGWAEAVAHKLLG